MHLLMIHPPLLVSNNHIDYPEMTPLAMWQNAAYLQDMGLDITVLDAFSQTKSERINEDDCFLLGEELDAFLSRIKNVDFDHVIIHLDPFCICYNQENPTGNILSEIVKTIRKKNKQARVIFADMHIGGMNYYAYDPKKYLKQPYNADCLLQFEGEKSLYDFIVNELDEQSGKFTKKVINGKPFENPLFGSVQKIYQQVDIKNYQKFLARYFDADNRENPFKLDRHSLPFKSSRGCKFNCSFCTSNPARVDGQKQQWRKLAAGDLSAGIKFLAGLKGVKKLVLLDELANADTSHFDLLLSSALGNNLALEFPNGLRADHLSVGQISKLSELISLLSLSPESGSKNVLQKIINKKQSLLSVERVCKLAYNKNLPVALHFITGLPGERAKDIKQTFSFAKAMFENYGAVPWLQFAVILKGTRLYDKCMQANILPAYAYDDISEMFQGQPMLDDEHLALSKNKLLKLKTALDNLPKRKN